MEAGALPRVGPRAMPALTPRLLRYTPDARLVGLVREGRRGAFEALYDRHSRGILSFCRHMLGDADEAEDAVQHTFMAAYRELMTSDKPVHLRPWLYAVARNRCYSILRGRREQPSEELEDTPTEGLAAEVQRREDLRELVSDMRQLPDEQRAALVLAELDALSHEDIAVALDIPRDKVKALVFQARESLLATRTARDTACSDIREQLANGRGATLRRANLRRHLRECEGCREFRAHVDRQRKQFAVLLPVLPTIALKEAVFGGSIALGGAAAVSGGAVATGVIKTGIAKTVIGAVLASVGTAGTLVVAGGGLPVNSLLNKLTHIMPGALSGSRSHRAGHHQAHRTVSSTVHRLVTTSYAPHVPVTSRLAAARLLRVTSHHAKPVRVRPATRHASTADQAPVTPPTQSTPTVSTPTVSTPTAVTPPVAATPAPTTVVVGPSGYSTAPVTQVTVGGTSRGGSSTSRGSSSSHGSSGASSTAVGLTAGSKSATPSVTPTAGTGSSAGSRDGGAGGATSSSPASGSGGGVRGVTPPTSTPTTSGSSGTTAAGTSGSVSTGSASTGGGTSSGVTGSGSSGGSSGSTTTGSTTTGSGSTGGGRVLANMTDAVATTGTSGATSGTPGATTDTSGATTGTSGGS